MLYKALMNDKAELIVFDRSARQVDADGRLHVLKSHISKANVCPYFGKEIPGYKDLGLQPDTVYKMFRDPVELKKGEDTFKRLQILSVHKKVSVAEPQKDLVIGSIGSDVYFEDPYLCADLVFTDATAIAGIETEQVQELSCSYRYTPVMEAGVYKGEAYDGRMTNIVGNHLALVEEGRAGSDVVVADANPFNRKEITMKMTKYGHALHTTLKAVLPDLAKDAAFAAIFADAKKSNKAAITSGLLAMDAKLDVAKLNELLLAFDEKDEDDKKEKKAEDEDETDEEKKAREAKAAKDKTAKDEGLSEEEEKTYQALAKRRKPAEDEEKDDDKVDKKEVKEAMDALRAELKAADQARRDVRDVCGDVAMDSATQVYEFALDHLKIDHAGIKDARALSALFKVGSAKSATPAPRIAMDANSVTDFNKRFPGVSRIKVA